MRRGLTDPVKRFRRFRSVRIAVYHHTYHQDTVNPVKAQKGANDRSEERVALIDEYGELSRQIDAFAPTVRRQKAIEEELVSWVENVPADRSTELVGNNYVIQVSERQYQRRILSMQKVYKAVGSLKAFLENCSFSLKALDALVKDQTGLVDNSRVGRRNFKAVARAAKTLSAT